MTSSIIRPFIAPDAPAVLRMIQGLARHHGDTPTLTLDRLRRDALGASAWIKILVAQGPETLLGYAALCPLAQLQFGVRGMDLHHLFVVQAARKQGVGRKLITASVTAAQAAGCRYLTVGTHPQNTAAAAAYRAIGFEELPQSGPRFRLKWEAGEQ